MFVYIDKKQRLIMTEIFNEIDFCMSSSKSISF